MKTNAQDYAFPDPASASAVGLTKREYFAAAALTGLVVPAIAGSICSYNGRRNHHRT